MAQCQECGSAGPAGARFCVKCGKSLPGTGQPAPSARVPAHRVVPKWYLDGLVVSAALSTLLSMVPLPPGPGEPSIANAMLVTHTVTSLSLYIVLVAAIVWRLGKDAAGITRQRERVCPGGITPAWWVVLCAVFPMLVVPVYLAVRERFCVREGLA